MTVRSTGGTGAFDLRVSSEANWDYLEFYIGDELVERWSGEIDWQSYQFELPAGLQTLTWRYVKDVSGVGGWDAAFIDNLELPLVPTTFLITNVRRGAFDIQTTGQPNLEFYIQASSDLLHWSNVATQPDGGSSDSVYRSRSSDQRDAFLSRFQAVALKRLPATDGNHTDSGARCDHRAFY